MTWDVFISHASEDKDEFVRPLAERLSQLGITVWYDEFSLSVGDSLRRSVDRGLAECASAIVVLSPAFFKKEWPARELDGLIAREIAEGVSLLPVWHGVSHAEVLAFSPPLADRVAAQSEVGIEAVANELAEVIRRRSQAYTGLDLLRGSDAVAEKAVAMLESTVQRRLVPMKILGAEPVFEEALDRQYWAWVAKLDSTHAVVTRYVNLSSSTSYQARSASAQVQYIRWLQRVGVSIDTNPNCLVFNSVLAPLYGAVRCVIANAEAFLDIAGQDSAALLSGTIVRDYMKITADALTGGNARLQLVTSNVLKQYQLQLQRTQDDSEV